MNVINRSVVYLENINQHLNDVTLQSMKLQHSIVTLEMQYQNLLNSFELLIAGRLPSYLVKKVEILKIIEDIDAELSSKKYPLEIAFKNPIYYYRHAKLNFFRVDDNVIISIQLPLTHRLCPEFELYRIVNFPMILPPANKAHAMSLADPIEALAVSTNHQFYYPLNLNELKTYSRLHYSTQKIFSPAHHSSCVMAIFQDDKVLVDKICNYTIVTNAIKPNIFPLENSEYLLLNIYNYTLDCLGFQKVYPGCESCVISIVNNCTLFHKHFVIPSTLSKEAETSIKHITNIPLLIKFFDPESLKIISGDTTLSESPDITLPDFEYFKHNLTESFAHDEKFKLSLHKTAQKVKENQVIASNIDEALILGQIPSPASTGSQSILSWILTAVIALISTLTIFLFYKLKQLTLAVAVLQASNTPRVCASHLSRKLILTYTLPTTPVVNNTVNLANFHQVILQHSPAILTYVLLGICITILSYLCIKKCYQKYLNFYSLHNYCEIILELTTAHKCAYVSILKLHGLPSEYTLTQSNFVNNIAVTNFIFPKLTFHWDSLKIINNITDTETTVPTYVHISILQRIIISRILANTHRCQSYFLYKNQRSALKFSNAETITAIEQSTQTEKE